MSCDGATTKAGCGKRCLVEKFDKFVSLILTNFSG